MSIVEDRNYQPLATPEDPDDYRPDEGDPQKAVRPLRREDFSPAEL